MENVFDRIGKEIDLKELNINVCNKYNLGNYMRV